MFIKLTISSPADGVNAPQESRGTVILNSQAIFAITRESRRTFTVVALRSINYYVRETPEEIASMIDDAARRRTRTGIAV